MFLRMFGIGTTKAIAGKQREETVTWDKITVYFEKDAPEKYAVII